MDQVVNPPRRISRRSICKQQPNCLLLATTICADRECNYLEHGAPEGVRKGRDAFRHRLSAELPAYVYFLLNDWKIEPEFVSQRYGVTHFHHQDILVQLGELAPETRLLQLIDAEIFNLSTASEWKGSAVELESRLLTFSSNVVHQARTLLSWQCACGTYLGRLKKYTLSGSPIKGPI